MTVPGNRILLRLVALISIVSLGACSVGYQQRAPEVLYSNAASETRVLQVPPDLTDISDGEQFVLPGTSGGAVTRNTLLPQFQNARFRRSGQTSWLQVETNAEALWPELLTFLRREELTILRTQPVNGLIETEWAPAVTDSGGSVLKNLLGKADEELYQRIAFRLERASDSTRVFIQVQQKQKEAALAEGANQLAWADSSQNNADTASALLQRLLVHLGVAEQRAKQILNDASAALIYDTATLERTAGGTQLILHRGYRQSYRSLTHALSTLGFEIQSRDITIGEIRAVDVRSQTTKAYIFKLNPVHVSAVKVAVSDLLGEPIKSQEVEALLQQIRETLV